MECDVKPFSKPWKLVERDEPFEVRDSASRTLAFVYFSDDPDRWNFMRRLSTEDARRMAQQILRLPELVRIARGIDPGET
ncbi:MAG TPA: hypothetical protein VGA15_24945 [Bradyrhizobium sp.]|jgi:hypothetical protein